MAFVLPILALIISILVYYSKSIAKAWRNRQRTNELLQCVYGPPTIPLLGNGHQFPSNAYDMCEWFIQESHVALEKGQSVMKMWAMNKLLVYPLNGQAVKDILDSTAEIKKGIDYDFFLPWLGESLLLSTGERWRSHRKMLTPTFHFNMLPGYMDIFNKHAQIFTKKLEKYANGDQVTNIYSSICACALDIIADAAMGMQLNTQAGENLAYAEAVKSFNNLSFDISTKPYYWLPGIWRLAGKASQADQAVKVLKQMSGNVVQQRMKVMQKEDNIQAKLRGKRLAFLDLLWSIQHENGLSFEDIQAEVDTFMFAGHDTTAHAISWALWCLACHPDIQQRLYDELLEHLGTDLDRNIEIEDLSHLKYLEQVIKESQRIFPSVPIIQRELQNEMIMDGKLLPAKANVMISPLIIHHNTKVYPDHDVFNPDNFSRENIQKRHAFDYIPFSAGQKFAMLEVKVVVVYVLKNFCISTNMAFHDNRRGAETVLKPKFGIPIKINKRQF